MSFGFFDPWRFGVAVIEAFRVGHADDEVGLGDVGDDGGEMVVVAELDLVDGDGVVFVDDGDDVPLHEGGEGVLHVDEPLAVRQIVHGEKDLGYVDLMLAKGIGVDAHDPALPDGGAGLLLGHTLELSGESHAVLARCDGAGRDDDDVIALLDLLGHLVDELLDDFAIKALTAREDAGPDLDNDPADAGKDLLALSAHVLPANHVSIFSQQPPSGHRGPLL